MLTKSGLVTRDIDLLRKIDDLEVGLTITTLDDDTRKIIEPEASSVEERLQALRELKDSGIRTYIFLGPIIPSITDPYLEEIFRTAGRIGIDYIIADRLRMKEGMREKLLPMRNRFPEMEKGREWNSRIAARLSKLSRDFSVPVDISFRDITFTHPL